jgi:inorganic triphosphatase YgiF
MGSGEGGGGKGPTEEREVKLAVDDDFDLPDFSELDGVIATDRGDERLSAVYWDSDDLGLCHAGVGLRHRNGVWTYKGRSRREGDALVREEIERSAPGSAIPEDLRERVQDWIDAGRLHPIAELDTVRHQLDVVAAEQCVELVHDRVTVLERGRTVSHFAEVEVEFAVASQELADRLVQSLVVAGAVVDTTPKYLRALRALGMDPPELPV